MKKVLFAGIFLAAFSVTGQKTIQFADPLPPNYTLVPTVDKAYFGSYKNTNSETTYLFDETGISIVSTIVAYVTREQLRESSSIQFRNGYLFGVVKGDSVPAVLEGERYYYGMRQKNVVIGSGSLHQLTRLDAKTYIVNFYEGSYFEPSIFSFENGKLKIVHGELAYQPSFARILRVASIERYGSKVDVIAPAADQWPELRNQLFAGETLNYLKVTE
jgi:hypothetical protein